MRHKTLADQVSELQNQKSELEDKLQKANDTMEYMSMMAGIDIDNEEEPENA